MLEASSEARNSAALATSSGVLSRPIGMLRLRRASIAATAPGATASQIGVSEAPGTTTFTRTPRGASSEAMTLAMACTAPLVAE